MKRIIAGLLALIMLLGSGSTAFAYPGDEFNKDQEIVMKRDERKGFPGIQPFSIGPGAGFMP
ncbi:MAG: hypothetical protein Q4P28_06570, partial [Tissierellia bacterium]|nr:hypothetical protein [Tissierellia bacterium]